MHDETLLSLLQDPAHWAFEGITDLVFAAIGAFVIAPILKHREGRLHRALDAEHGVDHPAATGWLGEKL